MADLIRNCSFKFKCTQSWSGLKTTDDDGIRYCDACGENVHRCETSHDIAQALEANWCVAIPAYATIVQKEGEILDLSAFDEEGMMLGDIEITEESYGVDGESVGR